MQGTIDLISAAAAEQRANPLSPFLLMAVLAVAFYLLLIRPQNKRRREQLRMQGSVRVGDRILTTSGMHATVVAVDDEGVTLEIAPDVQVRFVKQAIMQVLKQEPTSTDEAIDSTDDDAGSMGSA